MESRRIFPVTLILLLCLASVSCAAQGTLAGITETAAAPSATALPSAELPSATPTPTSTEVASSTPAPSYATTVPTLASVAAPSPSSPHPSGTLLALNDYKYRLIAQFGAPFYCDPDRYPVARPVSDAQVTEVVAALQKNPSEYQAILRFLGLAGTPALSAQQQRAVYEQYKMLSSIMLQAVGDKYEFSLRVGTSGPEGLAISGVIDQSGTITVTKREPTFLSCPICLAVNTMIDTPQGGIPVQDIRRGMLIWTADREGNRRAASVLDIVSRPVPAGSRIVQLVLDDGRELLVSPNHPTMDGRVIGDLYPGDVFDGTRVVSAARVAYSDGSTYDILPAGDTGAYWANGILLESTLAK